MPSIILAIAPVILAVAPVILAVAPVILAVAPVILAVAPVILAVAPIVLAEVAGVAVDGSEWKVREASLPVPEGSAGLQPAISHSVAAFVRRWVFFEWLARQELTSHALTSAATFAFVGLQPVKNGRLVSLPYLEQRLPACVTHFE